MSAGDRPSAPPGAAVGSILTINTGSSSIKSALYPTRDIEHADLLLEIERVGTADASFGVTDRAGTALLQETAALPNHAAAVVRLLSWLKGKGYSKHLVAVGHRVVHGGERYSAPAEITPEMIATLKGLVPLAPDHLPQALEVIERLGRDFPGLPQVACFDTAFHRRMPRVAQMYPLPRQLAEAGVLRYGFHGLSYEYITDRLRTVDGGAVAGRVVIAHLGNGSSMAAVHGGISVDTTMGFTPTGGLMMGTRSGDLDPGVLLYLLQTRHMSPSALNHMLNKEAGLLGVSGRSPDMRDLLARQGQDEWATLAVEMYCYQARKHLGALATVLGGLDTLVFTAGIGEHAPAIRERICSGLEFLGIRLNRSKNREQAPVISPAGGTVTVRVMHTDEDVMIARHTRRLLAETGELSNGDSVPV
ncbi:MAG TPA: acetate/propionate family kinase [Chloroflexota bacterium]|nr:acetate/propionate family kinase [Chloroflexota bacterium]